MTESKKGNIFIISEMVLWSLFPIVSLLGLKGLPTLVSLFWVNLFAAIFFFVIVIVRGRLPELKNQKAWKYTAGVVILINIVYYGLFFYALNMTTPSNASIVALFEIVPSYIFFQLIKKESFSRKHIIGLLCAIAGALIVLLPKAGMIHKGDFIILIAVFFPAFGNWCQQEVRKLISSESSLFLRHFLAIPFIFILITVLKTPIMNYNISNVYGWLLLNGILIFGLSKIFWLESIHRMSVTKALAINGLNPILTVFFSWLLLRQAPSVYQLPSLVFLIFAILLLTDMKFKKSNL